MANNRYKLLLLEDDAGIRAVVTAMLEAADYQVICAERCALGMALY